MESSIGTFSFASREKVNESTLSNIVPCDNLVGGHINQINIESKDVIVKKTSLNEV